MISVITINLNNAEGLQKTIESVVSQSELALEYIVIDGASADNSLEVIKSYSDKIKYWSSEPDTGIYNAMNKGILHSSGDYLLFLNSGDWLNNPDVLKQVSQHLHSFDVISGDIDIYDLGKWHSMKSEDEITVSHFFRLSLYHQATFISRKLFNRDGLYNEELKSTGDYEFFIRSLLKNNGTYNHIHYTISNFIANGISNDPAYKDLNEKEWRRAWELNFSENIINELKACLHLKNSQEIIWGRRLNKLMPF